MTGPDVSVVVPTRFRETRLAFALDALADQTLDLDRFEVVVVRAADAVGDLLTEAPSGLAVKFLTSPAAGAAAQRNQGWRAARGELIAFTDDDCRAAPDWLKRLLEAHRSPQTILQGRTEPDPDERLLLHGFARSMTVVEHDPWAPTCNIAYPRALLESLDGFDERFPAAWGEDTDLALRATESGADQAYVPDAVIWHAVHPRTLLGALDDAVHRNNIHIVVRRHPRQRRALYLRLFTKRTHALVLLAGLGTVLARRRPLLALLSAAPYLHAYFDRSVAWTPFRLARWLLAFIPRRAVVEGAEVAAMAVSSVKHRTPVL